MNSNSNGHVFLWTFARCVSTAFTRSMESIKDVIIYFEPFGCAEHFGPEGRLIPKDSSPSEMDFTFERVKIMLEDKTLKKKNVFVKDMGYAIDKRYDKIPEGFKHSFLIRHPAKSFLSYYNTVSDDADVEAHFLSWLPEGLGYKELWELFNHIENKEGTRPVVVNSDDLLENPKFVLGKYCEAVGLEYTDELLTWQCKPKVEWKVAQTIWDLDPIYHWFSNSLTAGGFKKSLLKPPPAMEDLPKIVQDCVEKSMPYYEKLNEYCIRPPVKL